MRRSLVRDQGEEIGRQVCFSRPRSRRGRYRSTRASSPVRLSRRGRPTLQSYERICERFPDNGGAGLAPDTQIAAMTQLLSGELRAGTVTARRPRAARAWAERSDEPCTASSTARSSVAWWPRDCRPCHTGVRGQPDDGEICFPEDMSNPSHNQSQLRAAPTKDDGRGQAPTTLADGRLARERPWCYRLGRSWQAKTQGRSRPSPFH